MYMLCVGSCAIVFCFSFKQKTAYEMRISDWSSDVCSSDLLLFAVLDRIVSEAGRSMSSFIGADEAKIAMWQSQVNVVRQALADRQANTHLKVNAIMQIIEKTAFIERSEEHTSELQSLMRISYAVFCLKKKKNKQPQTSTNKK